jgi:transposase-like protein
MSEYKRKSTASKISKRKPWQRLDGSLKARIVREILNGSIGHREASRKYNIHRTMLAKWVEKASVDGLLNGKQETSTNGLPSEMSSKQTDKVLLSKVKALTKELQYAQLKISGLETMITVAEEDLKIKIRKKRGSKQSKECDKATQK